MDILRKQQSADGDAQSSTECRLRLRTDQRGQEAAGRVLTETTEEESRGHVQRHSSQVYLFTGKVRHVVMVTVLSPADVGVHGSEPLQEAVRVT